MIGVAAQRWAQQVMDHDAAALSDPVDLLAEHEVGLGVGAIDEVDVSGPPSKGLEQRPQRSDADAARQQENPSSRAPGGGEGAIGSFGEHAHAGPEVQQRRAVVAGDLDRDPEQITVEARPTASTGWRPTRDHE